VTLSKEEIIEVNYLLKSKDLNLPDFRRVIQKSGGNYRWLQKHISERNPILPERLTYLLDLTKPQQQEQHEETTER